MRLKSVHRGLLAALILAVPASPAKGEEPATPQESMAAAPPGAVLTQASSCYDQAWQRREAGDLPGALDDLDICLGLIAGLDLQALDASSQRQAAELRARAVGLRDAVAGEAEDRDPAKPRDEVLDAPAIGEIEVQFNRDVYRWIGYFTGAGRSTFERWLRRSGRYMDMFRAILEREGLPSDLVHLVFVESGFNLNARSVSAAVGPWQFVRSTGRLFGLTVNQWVDERRDPEKSTVAAARYLKHLYQLFGDWPLALASYNAGEGTVIRAIKRQRTTNYWRLRLPRQTEDYVPQFMAVLSIVREPERYGFADIELEAPMDFDEITLVGPVDLRAVARLADADYEELRALNPAVLRHTATGRYGTTTLRVPRGTGEEIMRKLHSGEAKLPAVSLAVKHRVRRGETLKRIAAQYGVSAKALASANRISRSRPLRRGMVLTVPGNLEGAGPQPVPPDFIGPLPPAAAVPLRPSATTPLPIVATLSSEKGDLQGASARDSSYTVRVRRGETLGSIARREGVSISQLKRWNGLRRKTIRTGQRLRIEGAPPVARLAPALGIATDPGRALQVIRVQRGDTLSELARRHGTTVGALMKANGLKSSRSLRAGMRLTIPGA